MKPENILRAILIIIIVFFMASCGKKDDDAYNEKRKELEQKEKEISQRESDLKQKDSVKPAINYNWEGEYNYKTNNDRHNFEYALKITRNSDGSYKAHLDYSGFQTYQPVNCRVEVVENKINLYFIEYSEPINIKIFSPNDLLLSLEYNGNEVITNWKKAAYSEDIKNGIVAFKKAANSSFIFLQKELVFGTDQETFIKQYPEFRMDKDKSSTGELSASYIMKLKDCEISFNVYFNSSSLNRFKMHSNCSMQQDEQIIKGITKQFKFIPDKKSEEEDIGDMVETYKKGKLTATAFIGGFYELTIEKTK